MVVYRKGGFIINKIFNLTILFLFTIFICVLEVSAISHSSTRSGNGYHYAFYDSSVSNNDAQYFNIARNYWNQSPKVGIGRTYTRTPYTDKYSVAKGNLMTGILGEVYPGYYDNSGVARYNVNMDGRWDFVNVVLYTGTIQYIAGHKYSLSTAAHVAAHEVGHTLKQKHPPTNITQKQSVVQTGYMYYDFPVIPGGSGNVKITNYDLQSVNTKF